MAEAQAQLSTGRNLCIFPEGRLSETGALLPFQKGVAYLQQKTGAPIVPFALHGGFEAWPWGRLLPRLFCGRRRIRLAVHLGAPLYPAATATANEVTEALFDAVQQLMACPDVSDVSNAPKCPEYPLPQTKKTLFGHFQKRLKNKLYMHKTSFLKKRASFF